MLPPPRAVNFCGGAAGDAARMTRRVSGYLSAQWSAGVSSRRPVVSGSVLFLSNLSSQSFPTCDLRTLVRKNQREAHAVAHLKSVMAHDPSLTTNREPVMPLWFVRRWTSWKFSSSFCGCLLVPATQMALESPRRLPDLLIYVHVDQLTRPNRQNITYLKTKW